MKDKNKSSEGMVRKDGRRQKPPSDIIVELVQDLLDNSTAFISAIEIDSTVDGECWRSEIETAIDLYRSGKFVTIKRSDIEEQINALNHWLHLHAPEMCDKKYVKETKRVMEKTGVVGYITDRLETLRSYLRDGE